jgi:hypothetical protein
MACHLSTARIGLVDSGACIPFTIERGAKDALRQHTKPIDFNRFAVRLATICCSALPHGRSMARSPLRECAGGCYGPRNIA